jgi:hypothetical protein
MTAPPIDTRALIERCDIHADKADDAGMYTISNTLWLAARRLEQLHTELANAGAYLGGEGPACCVDACYADCISTDVPPGHDTILGYLARHHADVLDMINPSEPADTVRDGFKLAAWCKQEGLAPRYVTAPPILARQGIFTIRAYPLNLLQRRWG